MITASSSETDKGNVEAGAVDGNAETRWCASTGHLPEWLQFDLGEFRTFSTVTVDFEFPYEKYAYMLQVSPDGKAWVTVFSKKMNGISDSTPSKTMMEPVSPWHSTRKGRFEKCSTSTIT